MSLRTDIKTYKTFAVNEVQRLLSYKANVLIFIFGDVMVLLATYFLWSAIYQSSETPRLNGFLFNEMVVYVLVSFLVNGLNQVDVSWLVADEVKDGSIAINLIRPISFTKRMFYTSLGDVFYNFLVIGIPGFLFVGGYMWHQGLSIDLLTILLFVVSILFGFTVHFFYSYAFGLLSFKMTNLWGISQIMNAITGLLSGMIIPITFFPDWAQAIFPYFPFSSIVYTPTMIFLGKLDTQAALQSLGMQLFWIVLLYTLSRTVWKVLIKRLVILGG